MTTTTVGKWLMDSGKRLVLLSDHRIGSVAINIGGQCLSPFGHKWRSQIGQNNFLCFHFQEEGKRIATGDAGMYSDGLLGGP